MHREENFEAEMEQSLVDEGGYIKGDPDDYDDERALFPKELLSFVQATQPTFWERLVNLNGDKAETVLLDSLVKELRSKGMLTVLRSGFKCFGRTVRLAYFAPNTSMNPEDSKRYAQNQLTIIRQVKTKSGAIPDVVIAVNGLPVLTMELKNPMTGQRVENAIWQYRNERDPNELLFTFKQRCLVHFAVDPDEVHMTTRLRKTATHFLPFNCGSHPGQ